MKVLITHSGLVRPDDSENVLKEYGFTVDKVLSCECWTKNDNRCTQDDPNIGYVVIQLDTPMSNDELVEVATRVNEKSMLIEDISDLDYEPIFEAA